MGWGLPGLRHKKGFASCGRQCIKTRRQASARQAPGGAAARAVVRAGKAGFIQQLMQSRQRDLNVEPGWIPNMAGKGDF